MKEILSGRYEIIEEIGSGGMAQVYKARCKVLNRFVAIKVLKEEFINDQDFIEKFKQESMSAARLNHKNIVNVYDTDVDGDIYYIVMEFVSGITLNQLIQSKEMLTVEETIDISIQICEALDHAHSNGVIHRDIKPHNILISENNLVKVADFGIARAVSNKTMTNNDNTMGSVNYFSPEQARGGYVDQRSDIYSLGIVMYEMLTGEVPFKGESPISVALKHVNEKMNPPSLINNEVPALLDEIVLKCSNKKQTMRFNNINEIITQLKKVTFNVEIFPSKNELTDIDNEKKEAFDKFFNETKGNNTEGILKNDKLNYKENKKENNKDDIEISLKEKKPKSNRVKYTIFAIIAALLVTSLFSMLAISYIKDYLTVKEVEVPNLIGLDENTAKDTVENLGLEFKVKDRIFNEEFLEGQIINQNIKSGEKLKEGFPIEVIISTGEKFIIVPDLLSKYSNETAVIINESGLTEGDVSYEFSETIPWGLVISQSPEAGTRLKEGDKISYVLSKGPEVEYIIMPDLIGKSVTEATQLILLKSFFTGDITYNNSEEFAKDLIIFQSYPAGTEVEKGTKINLVVSEGPQLTTEAETTTIETSSGGVQIVIDLPQDKEKMIVLVERVLEDNRQIVYQEKHKKQDSPVVITVEGFGVQKFEIFIDSEYYGVEEIDFGN